MSDLSVAAQTVVDRHLAVRAGENVLIVTDEQRLPIGKELFEAARNSGAEVCLMEMLTRSNHGAEPPRTVAEAMKAADVVIAPTTMSLSHTSARRDATDRGARVASMPLITEDMMKRALGADPRTLRRLGRKYADALSAATRAHLTSDVGTDCMFDLSGRTAISDDGDLAKAGSFGNLPAGEAFIAPLESSAHGVIVFDGSISPDGLLEAPLRVTIQRGFVTEVAGGPAAGFERLPDTYGPAAWSVAELGVGTNDKALITGLMLEDEKVASTIHVAFGNNAFIGGTNTVPSHHDGVIRDATLSLDGRLVLEGGNLLLD